MAVFLAIPLLGLLVIMQSAILSQVRLLNGTVDLVLLVLVAWSVQERVKTAWHWRIAGAGRLVGSGTRENRLALDSDRWIVNQPGICASLERSSGRLPAGHRRRSGAAARPMAEAAPGYGHRHFPGYPDHPHRDGSCLTIDWHTHPIRTGDKHYHLTQRSAQPLARYPGLYMDQRSGKLALPARN